MINTEKFTANLSLMVKYLLKGDLNLTESYPITKQTIRNAMGIKTIRKLLADGKQLLKKTFSTVIFLSREYQHIYHRNNDVILFAMCLG